MQSTCCACTRKHASVFCLAPCDAVSMGRHMMLMDQPPSNAARALLGISSSCVPCRLSLLSGSVRTRDMLADNPGTWFFHCHVRLLHKPLPFYHLCIYRTRHRSLAHGTAGAITLHECTCTIWYLCAKYVQERTSAVEFTASSERFYVSTCIARRVLVLISLSRRVMTNNSLSEMHFLVMEGPDVRPRHTGE